LLDDERAVVVEDHQAVVFVDDVDVLPSAGMADVEPDPASLDRAVEVDRRDPDAVDGAALRRWDEPCLRDRVPLLSMAAGVNAELSVDEIIQQIDQQIRLLVAALEGSA